MDAVRPAPYPTVHALDDDIRFAVAMANSPIGMVLAAPTGAFLSVNPAMCAMLGRDEEELKASTWHELTHPADVGADAALIAEIVAGSRDAFRMRKRYLRPDQSVVWGDLSVSCVRDDHGGVSYLIGQIVDVTDHVLSKEILEQSRARYRLLAEYATDIVTLVNIDGTLEWVSPSLSRTLGWDTDCVVGQPVWSLIHPDDHAVVAMVLASEDQVIHGMPDVEMRLMRPDGSSMWMLAAGRHATETQLVVNLRQIEDIVRARETLMASEAQYRVLAENASDVVLHTGPDHRLAWVSPSVEEVLGWTPEQLVGQPFQEFVHPEDLEWGTHVLAEAVRTGIRPDGIEARFRKADGGWLWMTDRGRPIYDESGTLLGGIDSLRDIHREVQAREELRTSEARYRLLADHGTDVVYLVDALGQVTWISPAVTQNLGFEPEELIGTRMMDLAHPDDRQRMGGLRDALMAGQHVENPPGGWPARHRHKDGSYSWMALKTTVLRGPDGRMQSAVTGMRDVDDYITARDRAEREQARLEATLDSLLDPHIVLQALRDSDGVIVDFVHADANDAACEYMGMTRDELEGSRLLDVLPGHEPSGLLAKYIEAVESGEPLVLDDYSYRHEMASGDRRYDVRAVRLGDALNLTFRDVTERHEAAARIAESERHFRLLADNSSDVVLHSRDGIVLWVSPSLTRTLGWFPQDVVGTDSRDLVHPDDLSMLAPRDAPVGDTRVERYRLRSRDGVYHWCDVHSSDYLDENGRRDGIVASFRTIDDEVSAEQELEHRARYDELTEVFKRDEIVHRLQLLDEHSRQPGRDVAVLFCDVDNLKQVNDEYGHAAGDELLRVMAGRLRDSVRKSDTIARVGGDEFVIILDGLHGLDEAKRLAETIRAGAQEPIPLRRHVLHSSVSIGLSMVQPGEDPEQSIARADRAMYEAKRAGRNTVRILNPL